MSYATKCINIHDRCLMLYKYMTHVLRYKMFIYLSHMSYAKYYMKLVLCYIFMIPIYWFFRSTYYNSITSQ